MGKVEGKAGEIVGLNIPNYPSLLSCTRQNHMDGIHANVASLEA